MSALFCLSNLHAVVHRFIFRLLTELSHESRPRLDAARTPRVHFTSTAGPESIFGPVCSGNQIILGVESRPVLLQ